MGKHEFFTLSPRSGDVKCISPKPFPGLFSSPVFIDISPGVGYVKYYPFVYLAARIRKEA